MAQAAPNLLASYCDFVLQNKLVHVAVSVCFSRRTFCRRDGRIRLLVIMSHVMFAHYQFRNRAVISSIQQAKTSRKKGHRRR